MAKVVEDRQIYEVMLVAEGAGGACCGSKETGRVLVEQALS